MQTGCHFFNKNEEDKFEIMKPWNLEILQNIETIKEGDNELKSL